MKRFLILTVLASLVLSNSDCSPKKKNNTTRYKGRLEIKALCSNYTISLLEGNIDTATISTSWTDESTGKSYRNVFGLADPCVFPASLKQGDEFYFTVSTVMSEGCAVCQAYYPTPPRKLIINVLDK